MNSEQNTGTTTQKSPKRQRRVQRLKKMILGTILTLILVPVTLCIILGIRISVLQGRIETLQLQVAEQEKELTLARQEKESPAADTEQALSETLGATSTARSESAVSDNDVSKEAFDGRKIYLTFDDGPSDETDQILDILAKYHVKATFFVTGKDNSRFDEAYNRIVAEGHTLGMHSYSHNYATLYASEESFTQDLDKLQNFLYDKTGVTCQFYRFPGGSSNTVSKASMEGLIRVLKARGITYFDWNVSAGDASSSESADQIVTTTLLEIEQETGNCCVLLHDADDKKTTVEALPRLIEGIEAMDDTELLPITEDTVPIHHKSVRN